ncbi:PAS domain-containing hybrid sensor histidine kinase/response regulator [Chitinophaga sp. HK235]|uniref:PAS domain-containing hybrid sensor histidine kinase/response regulator n=1 Tax=Chitinophaga sp. HK235 TaxID=2952571 RepID=UPI001BA7A6D4|nr:response regulator [Chitinophaga sp. HK235]
MRKIALTVITLVIAVLMALSGFIFYAGMVQKRTNAAANWIRSSQTTTNQAKAIGTLDYRSTAGIKDYLLSNGHTNLMEQQLQDSILGILLRLTGNPHNTPAQQQRLQAIQQQLIQRRHTKHHIISTANENLEEARQMVLSPDFRQQGRGLQEIITSYIRTEQKELLQRIDKDSSYTTYSFWFTIILSTLTLTLLVGESRYIFKLLIRIRTWSNQLLKSEQSFRRLAEEAEPMIFKCSLNGFFTYVSPRSEEITGYSNTTLTGKHCSLLLEDDEFERMQRFYKYQLSNGDEYSSLQLEIITRSGKKKWVEQLASIITGDDGKREFECIVKDIDQEYRKSESIQYLLRRLEAILDYMPSMMFVKDMSGNYLLVNNRFMEVMQVRKENIVGKTDADLHYPWVSRYGEICRQVMNTGIREKMEETLTINDKTYHFLLTVFPLRNTNHEMIGICCLGQDLTEKTLYLQQEKEARKKAEEAQKSQETFLANMSHEIRTPMNGIVGMTQLLLQENTLSIVQQEYVTAIQRSASNLLVIINEILDFSKIKAGKLELAIEPFNLHEVINNAVFPLQLLAREKGLNFSARIHENIPADLLGDEVRLNQVLINLIENAIKFTSKGHVTVTVTLVSVDKDHSGIRIGFKVEDSGIGIPSDKIEVIFESFSQSHKGNSRHFGGTGLGLTICQHLIDLQNGILKVDSTPGKGSVFYFELPFTKDPFPRRQSAAPAEGTPKQPLLGKTILVVEDNRINQQVAYYTLKKGGCASVDVVDSGMAALEILSVKSYNCIIMDLQMPGMDGYETTRAIRNSGINTRIIAVTASALDGEKERCLQAGMNDYVSKPFQKEELFQKIQASAGDDASTDPVPSPEPAPAAAPQPDSPPLASGATSPQPPQKKIPPISFDDIYLMMTKDEVKMILEDLVLYMPDYITRLRQYIEERNWKEAGNIAHQLKGNLGYVCMHEAVQLAHEINRNVVFDPIYEELSRKAARIEELFTRYQPDIEAHIATFR